MWDFSVASGAGGCRRICFEETDSQTCTTDKMCRYDTDDNSCKVRCPDRWEETGTGGGSCAAWSTRCLYNSSSTGVCDDRCFYRHTGEQECDDDTHCFWDKKDSPAKCVPNCWRYSKDTECELANSQCEFMIGKCRRSASTSTPTTSSAASTT